MFFLNPLFWEILSLGLALPCSFVIIFNLFIKAAAGEQYQLNIKQLFAVYFLALLGWSIFFGVVM